MVTLINMSTLINIDVLQIAKIKSQQEKAVFSNRKKITKNRPSAKLNSRNFSATLSCHTVVRNLEYDMCDI